MKKLEMWGGLECTLNRVQDRYVNQIVKSGHDTRLEDLELFASLGIKKLRYPCLWEQVAPHDPQGRDWSWLDLRLEEIRRLKLDPIAGFLHHGSGPRYTSLIDPELPEKIASYARDFAERFPWICYYTPFNEINTTARFSCLYGHWYPHHQNDQSYLKALINQCRATILVMNEIKKINPSAKLIQTDDLGKIQSTSALSYQRDFENERRWLSFDLLMGKISSSHPLYNYFLDHGISRKELDFFQQHPCKPDYLGINHYHLSNRFLDEELYHYPAYLHGGNGRIEYADVGAIDSGRVIPPLPESILMEAWDRYECPLVITEVHARGYRESQMRWLNQMWLAAKECRRKGATIDAVTVWSLLGTFDWHNLCTKCEMFYEPGVFDLRSITQQPFSTAVAELVRQLAKNGEADHPILGDEGVWMTPRRILFGAKFGEVTQLGTKARPILITGGNGTLGQAFSRILGARNIAHKVMGRSELDITDEASVRKVLHELRPWAVINAAGYVDVDRAEDEIELCFRNNVIGPSILAKTTGEQSIPLVAFSTDLVFNGEENNGYLEGHIKSPLNVYGYSKAMSEDRILLSNPKSLIIRTSSFFGPWDDFNFITKTLKSLRQNIAIHAPRDVRVSPTYVPDLVNVVIDLMIDGETGLIHLTNKGAVSWVDFARMAGELASSHWSLDLSLIKDRNLKELQLKAPRPKNSVLLSQRWNILPSLENSLERYIDHFRTIQ